MAKKSGKPSAKKTTAQVVARVQSAVARKNGGAVPKGSYVGRLQSTTTKQSTNDK
jgi:hypothetical protein